MKIIKEQEQINTLLEITGRLLLDSESLAVGHVVAERVEDVLITARSGYAVSAEEIETHRSNIQTALFMLEHPLEYRHLRREVEKNSQSKSKSKRKPRARGAAR